MADDQDQGYVPLYQPGGKAQTAPPSQAPPPAPAKDPNDQGYVPLVTPKQAGAPPPPASAQGQPSGLGVNWRTGDVTMPQSVQDFGNVAGNEATMGTIASLRAQAEAARQRLGPAASAGADVAGNVLSPTSLLMGLPGGAPIAGALHEGIKSYAAGNPWGTIADDAAMGGVTGFGGQLAAKAAPVVLPQLTKAAVDLGPAAAMTGVAHKVFGDPSKDILSALGGYALMRNMSEGAGEAAKKVAEWAPTQQAIKSLILGGSSAFRQGTGPWDQWVPGQ